MGWQGCYDADTIDEFADQFAGNWKEFPDFVWHEKPDVRPSDWGIFYTKMENEPDSVRTSNHEVIIERLNPYYHVDVVEQCDKHWAFGVQQGFAVRVYNPDRSYTAAFLELYAIFSDLKDYPVLDDEHLSELEFAEMWDAWAEWGRDEFRRELSEAVFFIDDVVLPHQVSMDFSYLSDGALDTLIRDTGISAYWEHAGNRINFHYDFIISRFNDKGIDWIINSCFADLGSYSVADSKTGSLFPSV